MFKSIFKTATFKQSQITIVGTIINGALGALFYIVLARFLGPSDFGILTIALTTMVLIADIADVGTNTGLVRFVSANLINNGDKALQFLKLSLSIKLVVWIFSSLLTYILAPFLASGIFHKTELVMPLRLVAFGVGGALLFTFATSALQAFQKYYLWSLINIITNTLRLVLIVILAYLLMLNIEISLIIYIAMPFFGFFVALLFLPTKNFLLVKNETSLVRELFKYNIPVAIFTIIAAFSARLDTYMNAFLLSSREVGIYAAANQLVQIMPQLISALGLVAAPKFASFQTNKQMLVYLKKFQLLVAGICLVGIISMPFLIYLIPLLFGKAYVAAVMPFIFLFIAQLIFLFSIPVHQAIIFYFGKPNIFIGVSLGHLLIIGIVGYYLISLYGVVGASLTVLIGMIFNFLYPLGWLLFNLRKK